MLNAVRAQGEQAAQAAADRARRRVAEALRVTLPGVAITIEGDGIVLLGRLALDDPRLRWIAGSLR